MFFIIKVFKQNYFYIFLNDDNLALFPEKTTAI